MRYEWDPKKARLNEAKHGIVFADAVLALEDDQALTFSEQASGGEERFVTLGLDPFARVLVVVYTWRGDRIRIISARNATPRERRLYLKEEQ